VDKSTIKRSEKLLWITLFLGKGVVFY
jgi:hypothetical protein